jgi:hypothetical protein
MGRDPVYVLRSVGEDPDGSLAMYEGETMPYRGTRWPRERIGKGYVPEPDEPTAYELVREMVGGDRDLLLKLVPHPVKVVPIILHTDTMRDQPVDRILMRGPSFPFASFAEADAPDDALGACLRCLFNYPTTLQRYRPFGEWKLVLNGPEALLVRWVQLESDPSAVVQAWREDGRGLSFVPLEALRSSAEQGAGPVPLDERARAVLTELSREAKAFIAGLPPESGEDQARGTAS